MAQLLEHTLEERAAQVVAAEKKKKAKKEAAEEAEAKALEEQAGVAVALGASAAVVGVGAPAGGPQMPDDVRRFMIKMREGGAQASPEELFTMMRGFKDNVTLDHLYRYVTSLVTSTDALNRSHLPLTPDFASLLDRLCTHRDQLVAMARFLGMNAFAPTAILRFQIRQRLKKLRNEDKEIMLSLIHI